MNARSQCSRASMGRTKSNEASHPTTHRTQKTHRQILVVRPQRTLAEVPVIL